MRITLVFLLLCACAVPDDTSNLVGEANAVSRARTAMLGMDETDVRMCAGFPTARAEDGVRGKIWTYQKSYDQGNLNLNLPNIATGPLQGSAGAIGLRGAGNCSVQVRFEGKRVVQVEFAGDNNTPRSINGTCVPVIDSCVAYSER